MASSFASWFRGTPISNTAAGSTNHFAHAYRGSEGSPVVRVGVAVAAAASGGFRPGGSAAALVGQVIHAGGGLTSGGSTGSAVAWGVAVAGGARFSGAAASSIRDVAADSFRYWRRGASVSNSSKSSAGHFDYARRGSVGLPAVVHPAVRTFTAVASGGTSLGGSARPSRNSTVATTTTALGMGGSTRPSLGSALATTAALRMGGSALFGPQSFSAAATGGARFRGVAAAGASYSASAAGGLDPSGHALVGVSTTARASGGLSLGGRSVANTSAFVAASGGATFGGSGLMIELGYHIYINDGQGGPINYATPIDTVFETTWTSFALATPSSYQFGVRAFGSTSGLEERNLDASVRLEVDADGEDVTWTPSPPIGVRALPLAGGRVRVEWTAVAMQPRRRPSGFNVYVQASALTDYSTPVAVAPFATDRAGNFAVEIGPLADGATYAIGVRAFNASGEERNTACIYVDADSTPPSPIGALNATPIARIA